MATRRSVLSIRFRKTWYVVFICFTTRIFFRGLTPIKVLLAQSNGKAMLVWTQINNAGAYSVRARACNGTASTWSAPSVISSVFILKKTSIEHYLHALQLGDGLDAVGYA
jgi:hypothetical protein